MEVWGCCWLEGPYNPRGYISFGVLAPQKRYSLRLAALYPALVAVGRDKAFHGHNVRRVFLVEQVIFIRIIGMLIQLGTKFFHQLGFFGALPMAGINDHHDDAPYFQHVHCLFQSYKGGVGKGGYSFIAAGEVAQVKDPGIYFPLDILVHIAVAVVD